jgi:hypothetical protein
MRMHASAYAPVQYVLRVPPVRDTDMLVLVAIRSGDATHATGLNFCRAQP